MRLVTWNCYRGDALARAADVADLAPDLLALQECARPAAGDTDRMRWHGSNPAHGMALVTTGDYRLHAIETDADASETVQAAWLSGGGLAEPVFVLHVWAKPAPTYLHAIHAGLDAHAEALRAGPAIVLGDFNSHPRLDRPTGPKHGALDARLRGDFDLASAYHAFQPPLAAEAPTHYWRWQAEHGFHIDYCYLPASWLTWLKAAYVLDEPPGSRSSDHRPLVVEVASPHPAAR